MSAEVLGFQPEPGIPEWARAVLLSAPGIVEVTDVAVRPPGPDEVLIRVVAAGICGSDVELFAGNRPGDIVRYPVIPGHEWSGRVIAVGPGNYGFTPGDPVVAEGLRWCGTCARCREGSTNLCLAGYRETGFTEPGAFAEYVTVPARLVHRLPEDRPLEHAALLEPTACVVAALSTGALSTGAWSARRVSRSGLTAGGQETGGLAAGALPTGGLTADALAAAELATGALAPAESATGGSETGELAAGELAAGDGAAGALAGGALAGSVPEAGAPRSRQRVVVLGGGTLGLIAVQLLALTSPSELILVESQADRRELGARFGASATIEPAELDDAKLEADLVVEAAGAAGSGLAAVRAARRGGTVVLLGISGTGATPLPPDELAVRELHVHGVFGARADCWPVAISHFAAGDLDFGAMISHRFPLDDVRAAVQTASRQAVGRGKVLLRPTSN
jgi:threonine dehydrogenase-like Zn-dependent dehydrogenase